MAAFRASLTRQTKAILAVLAALAIGLTGLVATAPGASAAYKWKCDYIPSNRVVHRGEVLRAHCKNGRHKHSGRVYVKRPHQHPYELVLKRFTTDGKGTATFSFRISRGVPLGHHPIFVQDADQTVKHWVTVRR